MMQLVTGYGGDLCSGNEAEKSNSVNGVIATESTDFEDKITAPCEGQYSTVGKIRGKYSYVISVRYGVSNCLR